MSSESQGNSGLPNVGDAGDDGRNPKKRNPPEEKPLSVRKIRRKIGITTNPKPPSDEEIWLVPTTEGPLQDRADGMHLMRNLGGPPIICNEDEKLIQKYYVDKGGENKLEARNTDLKMASDKRLVVHCHSTTRGKYLRIGTEEKEEDYNAKQFADYLIEKGLDKRHRKLEIFACYSNFFICPLFEEMGKKGYNNISITGYMGECVPVNAGSDEPGETVAGLYKAAHIKEVKSDGVIGLDATTYNSSQYKFTVSNLKEVENLKERNKVVSNLMQKLQEAEKKLNKLKSSEKKLEQELKKLNAKEEKLGEKLDKLEQEKKILEVQRQQLEGASTQEIEANRKKIEAKEEEINNKYQEVANTQESIMEKETAIEEQTPKKEAAIEEIEKIATKLRTASQVDISLENVQKLTRHKQKIIQIDSDEEKEGDLAHDGTTDSSSHSLTSSSTVSSSSSFINESTSSDTPTTYSFSISHSSSSSLSTPLSPTTSTPGGREFSEAITRQSRRSTSPTITPPSSESSTDSSLRPGEERNLP